MAEQGENESGEELMYRDGYNQGQHDAYAKVRETLVASARKLVDILDEREKFHGALIGPETLNARNELALELSRWKS